jgi:Mn2+/Fe2+ NRAMP family transporter
MKLILSTLFVVAAVVLTAGLYLAIRKPDQKKTDLEKLQMLLGQIAQRIQQAGDYLSSLFGSKPEATIDKPTVAPTVPVA